MGLSLSRNVLFLLRLAVHYEITSHRSKLERLQEVPGGCHKHRSIGSDGNKPTIH